MELIGVTLETLLVSLTMRTHLICADVGLDTVTFHVDCINDMISVLTSEGKLTGTNVAPYSS